MTPRRSLLTGGLSLALAVAASHARADEPTPAVSTTTTVAPQSVSVTPPSERPILGAAVLGGTGAALAVVGVVLVAAAPSMPAACDADTRTCIRAPGESAEQYEEVQDRAGRAHAMPLAGWLTVGLGGMLVSAGILTYVFGADARRAARASFTPYGGTNGLGMVGALKF
jgi:hypothetical protein